MHAQGVQSDLRRQVLERAVQIAGGALAFAARMQVEDHSLRLWTTGRARIPEWVFLCAVDIVLHDDVARSGQDRRKIGRLPAAPPPSPQVLADK